MPPATSPHDHYLEHGYIIPVDILTPDEVLYYRAMFDRIERDMGKEKAQLGVIQKHVEDQDVWNLATHPKVIDAVEMAAGPNVVLTATHFFVKYPDAGERFVAWHQDVTYWGFEPPKATTIWLAIDDADVENGCMRVIPGSHKRGQLPHGKSTRPGNLLFVNQEIPIEMVDESTAIDFPLRAGQASVHDGLTIHGSNPNRSGRRRCGMTIRFTTPDVKLRHEENFRSSWKPMLLRGEDRFGAMKMLPFPFPLPSFPTVGAGR
ncbi:MAG: phytanoyl-CoA dioxygenase family protein [Planctomycetes bacterium]|nr:phytanoyl-CoA dioxygenase family protein [Planctomycetota bacterium]